MSIPADPIEGYYAQQVAQPSATVPTVRTLLEVRRIGHSPAMRLRADDALAARVEATLALHYPRQQDIDHLGGWCDQCDHDWPCPTVRALDGRKP